MNFRTNSTVDKKYFFLLTDYNVAKSNLIFPEQMYRKFCWKHIAKMGSWTFSCELFQQKFPLFCTLGETKICATLSLLFKTKSFAQIWVSPSVTTLPYYWNIHVAHYWFELSHCLHCFTECGKIFCKNLLSLQHFW